MLRTARLLPLKGFRHWASPPKVSPRRRQSATGPPDSYPDRTCTGKQRRARLTINRLHDQPPVSGRTAEQIKSRIATFLREDMKLELSKSKTLITHATSQAARFLGYEIKTQRANNKLDRRGQRVVNPAIGLFVPRDVIRQKCANYMRKGKRVRRLGGELVLVDRRRVDVDVLACSPVLAYFRGARRFPVGLRGGRA